MFAIGMGMGVSYRTWPLSNSFNIQDVGTLGWEYPTLSPTVFAGADRTARLASTETGSRIYYIDPENGIEPANQTDALSMVMFWNGTNLVDADGNTAPTSGPYSGISYGTNPHMPSESVPAFKQWSCVAPKSGGTENVYKNTVAPSQLNTTTSQWRSGKPDWWLWKRGTTWSMYDDVRRYYDITARTATAVTLTTLVISANGGTDSSNPACIGVYGATSLGRARWVHPIYGFFRWNGSATYPMKHQKSWGIFMDGGERNRAVRPVDWSVFPHDEYLVADHCVLGNFGSNMFNLTWEDCHFYASSNNVQLSAINTHTATNPQYDWSLHRCLITDGFNEGTAVRVLASKALADPDQTVSANTEAVVTWPTETTDTLGYFASNTFTLGASGSSWKFWPLMDIVGDIDVGGELRVSLFKNGVEIDYYTIPGTGVAGDTYKCYKVLRPGYSTQASGSTYDIRINSTGATSSLAIKGAAQSRLVISILGTGAYNGIYAALYPGSRYQLTESILTRNGFSVNPRTQTNYIPDGIIPRYDWNILNHNLYTVGDSSTDCLETGNVIMLGGAGELIRNRALVTTNLFYTGYISISLEQRVAAYTSKTGEFNDNVVQRFKATAGTTTAHPGWGILLATGAYDHEIKRNIITDVFAEGSGDFAVKIASMASPYAAQNSYRYKNAVTNCIVDGNIFDSTSSTAGTEVLQEVNGANRVAAMWNTTLSGTISNGSVITATPNGIAGVDYTGTPSYEWVRFTASTDTSVSILGPGATNTWTLNSGTNDFTNDTDGNPQSLVIPKITGITYVTGQGITGTQFTNNTVVKPSGKSLVDYYSSDSAGGKSLTDIVAIPPVPSSSDVVTTGTVSYTTRESATSALGGTNADASLKTALQSIGVTVSTSDGFTEFDNIVVGADPVTTAMRYGQWDNRLLGRQLGNHIRTGRGMATVS